MGGKKWLVNVRRNQGLTRKPFGCHSRLLKKAHFVPRIEENYAKSNYLFNFRLERLWVLLDSGSTPVTRKAAATQIGEIQKFHPHELNNLLRKVNPHFA